MRWTLTLTMKLNRILTEIEKIDINVESIVSEVAEKNPLPTPVKQRVQLSEMASVKEIIIKY